MPPPVTIFLQKLLRYIRKLENSLFIRRQENNKIHPSYTIHYLLTNSRPSDRSIDRGPRELYRENSNAKGLKLPCMGERPPIYMLDKCQRFWSCPAGGRGKRELFFSFSHPTNPILQNGSLGTGNWWGNKFPLTWSHGEVLLFELKRSGGRGGERMSINQ